jgi:hypothetical protein
VGNTVLMNEHRLSEPGEHEAQIADDGKLPVRQNHATRNRTGVPNRKNQRLKTDKNKIKTPLTRPASLERTHYLNWS